ncbi:hypothetical protein RIF29_11800 [Crotalaria pallida]|uniref:Uncharacterized protein n=1 Tax=Crotalaria pallida TaxID=3830 RepID=A0AAN9IMJ2_CROPI
MIRVQLSLVWNTVDFTTPIKISSKKNCENQESPSNCACKKRESLTFLILSFFLSPPLSLSFSLSNPIESNCNENNKNISRL